MLNYSGDILDYFPTGFDPRPKQKEILGKIQDALKKDQKFIICQAPTGSGKSHIGATLTALTPKPDAGFIDLVDNHEILARDSSDTFAHEEYVNGLPAFNCY